MRAPGQPSLAVLKPTTASGAGARSCGIMATTAASYPMRNALRKNGSFSKSARTHHWYSMVMTVLGGVSSDRRRSFHASTTSAPIAQSIRPSLTGGSPASFPAKGIAARALPMPRRKAQSNRLKSSAGPYRGLPRGTEGRKASPAFLFNGSLSTFKRLGFEPSRLIGKHKWVVNRVI